MVRVNKGACARPTEMLRGADTSSIHICGETSMVRNLIALLAATACLALAACNTVRGVGQDLESAADTVDDET